MKKNLFLVILLFAMVILPMNVFAKDGNPVSETLKEAAANESIEFNKDYKTSDSKPNIYLFRGHGCGYCYKMIEYLTSIIDEYGKYFNLVSYEVWYDEDNSLLFRKVASVLDDEANGVPYLVIGEKSFVGYTTSYNSDIEAAIKEYYNSSNKYDVMDHLDEAKLDETDSEASAGSANDFANTSSYKQNVSTVLMYIVILATFAGCALYIIKSNHDLKMITDELNLIRTDIKRLSTTNEAKKEVKKEVKKEKKN